VIAWRQFQAGDGPFGRTRAVNNSRPKRSSGEDKRADPGCRVFDHSDASELNWELPPFYVKRSIHTIAFHLPKASK
jgi:hypothetical protein